jgi:hypothetical protein
MTAPSPRGGGASPAHWTLGTALQHGCRAVSPDARPLVPRAVPDRMAVPRRPTGHRPQRWSGAGCRSVARSCYCESERGELRQAGGSPAGRSAPDACLPGESHTALWQATARGPHFRPLSHCGQMSKRPFRL